MSLRLSLPLSGINPPHLGCWEAKCLGAAELCGCSSVIVDSYTVLRSAATCRGKSILYFRLILVAFSWLNRSFYVPAPFSSAANLSLAKRRSISEFRVFLLRKNKGVTFHSRRVASTIRRTPRTRIFALESPFNPLYFNCKTQTVWGFSFLVLRAESVAVHVVVIFFTKKPTLNISLTAKAVNTWNCDKDKDFKRKIKNTSI